MEGEGGPGLVPTRVYVSQLCDFVQQMAHASCSCPIWPWPYVYRTCTPHAALPFAYRLGPKTCILLYGAEACAKLGVYSRHRCMHASSARHVVTVHTSLLKTRGSHQCIRRSSNALVCPANILHTRLLWNPCQSDAAYPRYQISIHMQAWKQPCVMAPGPL